MAFSIIICARNEAKNLEECLIGIISQQYPKNLIEIIVIDDSSEDETAHIAEVVLAKSNVHYQIIRQQNQQGKKKGIIKAIAASAHDIIITRDADTFQFSSNWLSIISNYLLVEKKEFVICPVVIPHSISLLGAIQHCEAMVLQVVTFAFAVIKKPFLCSGANLVFSKNLFYQTGAYQKHINIPSGDDVFFLEDVQRRFPDKVGYLNCYEALIYTKPCDKTSSLFAQKWRWAGKAFQQTSILNVFTAFVVLGGNLAWLWLLILIITGVTNIEIGLIFMFGKLLIDNLLVFLASRFTRTRTSLFFNILASLVYPLYTFFVMAGSVLVKPKWKP